MTTTFDLTGKIALVTGASSGLGARFARVLAANGAQVVLASRRVERLKELRAEIESDGGAAHVVAMDVTDLASIRSAVAHAETEAGPIDILVNNSGVSTTQKLVDVTDEDYDFVFDTNTKGAFFVAQEVAKRMIARSRGSANDALPRQARIINIASMAALKVLSQIGLYCMSKAAVVHMTKAMALEWGRYNINVMPSAQATSSPNSTSSTGRPKPGASWSRCCRASASARPRIWTVCWCCSPRSNPDSSTAR